MSTAYERKDLPQSLGKLAWSSLGLGALLMIVDGLWVSDAHRFIALYFVAFITLAMVGLGALFFILLEHLTGAVWSVPYRRLAEITAKTLPLTAIFGLPILVDLANLYVWVHPDPKDAILAWKSPFLNPTFFCIRYVLYFALWSAMAWIMARLSKKQDLDGDAKWTRKSAFISGPFMVLLGFSLALAGFDWVMSLEPHWFSSLFGGHVLTATIMVGIASFALIATFFARKGLLHPLSQNASWLPFGGFLFAFSLLSVYTGFVQVWLTWYGNIAEETGFYLDRWQSDSWQTASWILIFGYFLIPFFGMLSFRGKRVLWRIRFWAIWMLAMHLLHFTWIVLGTIKIKEGHVAPFSLNICDLGFVIFALGFFLVSFGLLAKKQNLIPLRDPKLSRGLHWH